MRTYTQLVKYLIRSFSVDLHGFVFFYLEKTTSRLLAVDPEQNKKTTYVLLATDTFGFKVIISRIPE